MTPSYATLAFVIIFSLSLLIVEGMEGTRHNKSAEGRRKKTLEGERDQKKNHRRSGGKFDPKHITWGRPQTDQAYFHPDTHRNITVLVGQKARLPCTVFKIEQEDVSWIRQRDLHILTVGIFTYTSDDRFKVYHPEGSSDWYLEINPTTFRDSGIYECQVSTSPKIFLPVALNVEVQQAKIKSPTEIFVQNGSTISLTCIVNTESESVTSIRWFRGNEELDYDSKRGGVSLEVEKTPDKTTSKLFLTKATKKDSGNYTCVPKHADPATVLVHVVSGEESAAVQAANNVSTRSDNGALASTLLILLLLYNQRP